MNRISKESLGGGRSFPVGSQHQRGRSLTGILRDTDENLDLFSRNLRSLSIASSDESEVSMKLGRLSVGSAKLARSGLDDLLSSIDGGKHDYDWLLTPPGTPLFSSDAIEPQTIVAAPISKTRSASTTRASRLSVAQSDNSYSSRSIRSTSVTLPSVSSMHYNTYSYNSTRSSSFLNTSSASVTSSKPSTPTARSTFPSTARPSTPSTRPAPSRSSTPAKSRPSSTNSFIDKSQVSSRSSTPAKSRPTPTNSSVDKPRVSSRSSTPAKSRPMSTNSSVDKPRVSQSPRPSTPIARPQTPTNVDSPAARSSSRPSTPTRRGPVLTPAPSASRSASPGRVLSNGRNPTLITRGSSPGPRARPPQQPIVPPDFPLDTPPNLRTKLPDRPVSAGRLRPGTAVTLRGNSEVSGPVNPLRRHSSPLVRGRLSENSGRGHLHSNGDVGALEPDKTLPVSGTSLRRHAKSATATDSTGFGRTISKKSLDMALRHMDIRHGTGSIRSVSGTSLFPQSIRGTPKGQPAHSLDTQASISSNSSPPLSNGVISNNRNNNSRPLDDVNKEDHSPLSAKLSEPDIRESSRYDAILLNEEFKNTNWLHSADGKSDQGLLFDHRFEPLPEPFGLL